MKAVARFSLSLAAAAALTATAALADAGKPVRHLVYNFDVTLNSTSTVHDSGIGGGPVSGSTDYHAGNMDKGQIIVDVVTVQPDNGLVVNVSERAENTRNSVPTMCVAYGNGAVVCDQSHGDVNEEEMSLLRVIGKDFVNQALIDSKHHWQYAQSTSDAKETNDYTIDSTSGDLLAITYQRYLKVATGQPFEATTNGKLHYNEKMTVPTSLSEDTITRKNTGGGNYDRIEQRVTLTLASDSMQAVVNQ
jgi:hypothetical protein